MRSKIGVHIHSNPKYILEEAERYHNTGANLLQIFVNPMYKDLTVYDKFGQYLKNNNMSVVVHASYSTNCAKNWNEHSWWIKLLIMEIEIASRIGASAIIIHLGKKLELTIEEAMNNMYTSLLYVHKATMKYSDVSILIETSAGQGTEICYRLDDLGYLFRKFNKHKMVDIRERFGLCLDTCHVFAAGYDITNKEKVSMFLDTLEETVGLRYIKLLHLNDSKKPLGSRVDRHTSLGKGFIGLKPLQLIAKFFIKMNVPILLETPHSRHNDEIDLLKK